MQVSKRLPYLALAACSILYFSPFLHFLSQTIGDEGTLIVGADRVAQGQVPFRDFFEVMGPGTFYWLALFFKVFGTTWLATRIELLVTTLGITLLLFYLARRLRGGLGAAPIIFFVAVSYHVWHTVSHHLDSTLFGLLAFAAFVFWMDRPRPFASFLAGAAAGLTTWIMLPKGLLLFLSFALLLWILYRKNPVFRPAFAALLGGFLLVNATVVALFWAAGGLPNLIHANLVWPLTNYSHCTRVPYGFTFQYYLSDFMSSLKPVFSPVVADTLSGILSAPFVVVLGLPLVLLGCVVCLRRSAFDRTTLPYWIAGAAFWLSELHRKDMTNVVCGSPLLVLLAFSLCSELRGKWVRPAIQMLTLCAVCLASLNPMAALLANHQRATRRGNLYGALPKDPVLDFLNTHVTPGDSLFVYPYSPMYYFLSAARNPTRYSILVYGYNTDQEFREVVRTLDDTKVRYVVWDRSFPTLQAKRLPACRMPLRDELIVEPYLMAHYRVVGGADDGYQFLERRDLTESAPTDPVGPTASTLEPRR
jgi:hypothetical protein